MTADNDSDKQTAASRFPSNLATAPVQFWRQNKLAALVFLVVNLLFGTLGLWLPPVNALFSSQSFLSEILRQLNSGGLYIYAITFLSAIGGATFTSIAGEKIDHSRDLKVLLAGSVVVALVVCALFLQIQLLVTAHGIQRSNLTMLVAHAFQVIVGFFTTVVAIYVYSIVNIEESDSPKTDLDRASKELLEKSKVPNASTKGAWRS